MGLGGHLHEGLQKPDTALGHGLSETGTCRNLEGKDARVHIVVAAIVQDALDVHHGESSQRAGAHHLLQTLQVTTAFSMVHIWIERQERAIAVRAQTTRTFSSNT